MLKLGHESSNKKLPLALYKHFFQKGSYYSSILADFFLVLPNFVLPVPSSSDLHFRNLSFFFPFLFPICLFLCYCWIPSCICGTVAEAKLSERDRFASQVEK